ncbi:MAG TPA: aminoglycoside phosphotransferase family protein [Natrialbaceae archaeon]|nr:aminoglycoside phosphotransferase family protein [Natrialbaceae archaeon]
MQGTLHGTLARHADDHAVFGELHDVPPHRVYEVRLDGDPAILKVADGPRADPATEARVMEYVGEHTSIPVHEILAVGEDYYLAEWCDDLPGDDPEVGETHVRTLGRTMAKLHAEAEFDAPGRPRASGDSLTIDTRESWHAVVRDHLRDLRGPLADAGRAGIVDFAMEFLPDHPGILDDAGDPVLCHGTLLPDHLALDPDDRETVTGVIDFEHAIVGPPEYDYWRTALPLEANEGEWARSAFREGYAAVDPLPEDHDRHRLLYTSLVTLTYLESLYVQDQHDRRETERQANWMCEYVEDSLGELEERLESAESNAAG